MVPEVTQMPPASVLGKVRAGQARIFWERLANLRCDPHSIPRSLNRFLRFYGPWFGPLPAFRGEHLRLIQLSNLLKSILLTEDVESREWLLRHLSGFVARYCGGAPSTPTDRIMDRIWSDPWGTEWSPPEIVEKLLSEPHALEKCPSQTHVEQALPYLSRSLDRFQRCHNPQCEEPYFIADHRNQKYCSTPCSLPAKRESKLLWWNGNRKYLAKQRSKEKSKRKRGK